MKPRKNTILLLTILAFGSVALLPQTNTQMVEVSIIFNEEVNLNILKNYDVEITYEFSTFPAVNAYIPEGLVEVIANIPFVKTVEIATEVYLLEDTLDWGVDRVDADIVWGGSDGALDVTTSIAGSGVKVAVIDTGIDYTHPDLAAAYAGGYDFVNDDNDPLDDQGHGTHVAGTIAAQDDEPNALAGSLIGTAPKVSIYAVKVLDNRGSGSSADVAAGIDWAAANGMQIASLSLGSSSPSTTIQIAGENAYAAGVLLVAASGNDGAEVGYPAAFPEFIAVGATDINDQIADFSNFGPELEISAPGVDITSTTPTYKVGNGIFAPALNYDTWSGTSMATPHVSGVAALVFSADPSLTNVDVRSILQNSAEDLGAPGKDDYYGYGLVDAEAAVALATGGGGSINDTTPPAQVTGLTASVISSSQIDLAWDANSESDLSHYNVYRDGVLIAQPTTNSFSDTGLSASTTYTYEVSAVDTSSNEGTKSDPVNATTLDASTTTMYVLSITFVETFFAGTYTTYATVTVVDAAGNPLEGVIVDVQVTFPDGSIGTGSGTTDANGEVVFSWNSNSCGTYTLDVTGLTLDGYVWDTSSGITSASFDPCA